MMQHLHKSFYILVEDFNLLDLNRWKVVCVRFPSWLFDRRCPFMVIVVVFIDYSVDIYF